MLLGEMLASEMGNCSLRRSSIEPMDMFAILPMIPATAEYRHREKTTGRPTTFDAVLERLALNALVVFVFPYKTIEHVPGYFSLFIRCFSISIPLP